MLKASFFEGRHFMVNGGTSCVNCITVGRHRAHHRASSDGCRGLQPLTVQHDTEPLGRRRQLISTSRKGCQRGTRRDSDEWHPAGLGATRSGSEGRSVEAFDDRGPTDSRLQTAGRSGVHAVPTMWSCFGQRIAR